MKRGLKGLFITLAGLIIAILLLGLSLMVMASRYSGKWKIEAYGFCFDVKAGYVKTYEVTDHYYARMSRYDGVIINGTLYSGIGKFQLEKVGKQLDLVDHGSQVTYSTNLQSKKYFKGLQQVRSNNPVAKFHMFYEILKENYAFADLYGVDFDAEFKQYASSITEDTSDETLYQTICRMVEKLDDGHVYVDWKGKEYSPSDCVPDWITDKDKQNKLGNTIKSNYVKDYYKFEDCYIRYGTLSEDIGYINITGLGMEELNKAATSKKAMDKIIKKFKDKNTIVIDLRFCGGGFDEASLMIAGYFTQNPYLTYKKQAYDKENYTMLQDIYVKPGKLYYPGKVVVLTSSYTISAGETLTRSLRANPDKKIQLIGEKTAGYYSDAIPRSLPGGFEFAMSSERYFGPDDTLFEGRGNVPDVEIPINVEDAENGKDKALDYVLENY